MEEEWMRDRARLRELLLHHPDWGQQDYAQAVGRSISWVKKWRKRLQEADPHDVHILLSRSRAHHTPYPSWDPRVEERIVEMRLSPPEQLKRVPGPRALVLLAARPAVTSLAGAPPTLQSDGVEDPAQTWLHLGASQAQERAPGAESSSRRDPDGLQRYQHGSGH
ncbi:hypothetical protein KSD_80390 [Ktedonobacter sp. SOSP1-85]|uniref:hypothetical protein n=1 Tax=Ktedonobacter sp. SOSP1-85 TaxID=2778367 RepID=UPI001A32E4B2|nr:hypothetical protein [Ktedonobacter sp. SOSP1-85]GHO80268.1 hypothetical protein KSD_80390 [Ktedonobacter sp. SOSP1-85]